MNRAVEIASGTYDERVALHSDWRKWVAAGPVAMWSLSSVLNLLVNFRRMVETGEWALMLFVIGVAGVMCSVLYKILGLAAVHLTWEGVEVRRWRRVRTASWDDIAQIQLTEYRVVRAWYDPIGFTVVTGRIRFVDGRTSTFVAGSRAREIWNSGAPKRLSLKKRRRCFSMLRLFVWQWRPRRRARSARSHSQRG